MFHSLALFNFIAVSHTTISDRNDASRENDSVKRIRIFFKRFSFVRFGFALKYGYSNQSICGYVICLCYIRAKISELDLTHSAGSVDTTLTPGFRDDEVIRSRDKPII